MYDFKAFSVILTEFVKSIFFPVNTVRHFILSVGMVFKNVTQGCPPSTSLSSLSTYFLNFLQQIKTCG